MRESGGESDVEERVVFGRRVKRVMVMRVERGRGRARRRTRVR